MTQPLSLPDRVAVVNVGLPLFGDAIREQGAPVISVDWRVPVGGQPAAVAALDPWQIVVSRTTLGGAAPDEVTRMAEHATAQARELAGEARRWRETYQAAEDALVAAARRGAAGQDPEIFAERSVT